MDSISGRNIRVSVDGGVTWSDFDGACREFNPEITPESIAFTESLSQHYEVSCTINYSGASKNYFYLLLGYSRHEAHCLERKLARKLRDARLAVWNDAHKEA